MKILLTGGGTGGHITPLLAVAHDIKNKQPEAVLIYVGERGSKFADLTAKFNTPFERRRFIFAGKFRRYHDENWLKRLLDIKTNLLNARDAVRAGIGFLQSLSILLKERPDVVFVKGGFVGVPLGLAAALLRIPYVTHDSDTVPGLANKIIGRWARIHATGMPAEFYNYPAAKMRFTGIPVDAQFKLVSESDQAQAKKTLGVSAAIKVILVTGGSLGSQRLNDAMVRIMPELLARDDVYVIHHVGRGNENVYKDFQNPRLKVEGFISQFHKTSAAADVVVARAGATAIAELAIQAKPVIFVPSPFLAGGHQLKNAAHLETLQAARVIQEIELIHDPSILLGGIIDLLDHPDQQRELARNLSALGRPNAAKDLADILLEVASA